MNSRKKKIVVGAKLEVDLVHVLCHRIENPKIFQAFLLKSSIQHASDQVDISHPRSSEKYDII